MKLSISIFRNRTFRFLSLLSLALLIGCTSSPESIQAEIPEKQTDITCAETRGTTIDTSLAPAVSPISLPLIIHLPPCYDQSDGHYPVLYLLHGGGATAYLWDQMDTYETADRLMREGEIRPKILVAPTMRSSATNPRETYLIETVIPYIDDTYRTLATPSQRGLTGMSVGGLLTMEFGLKNPDLFGSLAMLAPAGVYEETEALLDSMPPNLMPNLYLDVGDRDGLLSSAENLHAILNARDIPHEFFIREGDHTLPYWQRNMHHYLIWFDSVFE